MRKHTNPSREEYDWQLSKYIVEAPSRPRTIDEHLHHLGMTKGPRKHSPRSLKENVQAWEQGHKAQLTRTQQRALHEIGQQLDYASYSGVVWSEQTPEEIEKLLALSKQGQAPFAADFSQETQKYDAMIRKAWRVGLADHPLVVEWVLRYRALGYRKLLRPAKSGLERGIQGPLLRRARQN